MNRIIYTMGFLEDMLQVESERVENEIFHALDLLPHVPVLGSCSVPSSLQGKYGANARKMAIPPFDVVYAITDDEDFLVLGVVHMRSAR